MGVKSDCKSKVEKGSITYILIRHKIQHVASGSGVSIFEFEFELELFNKYGESFNSPHFEGNSPLCCELHE